MDTEDSLAFFSLSKFLVLTLALSTPWWLLSLVLSYPGLPDRLPITDVGAVFMPALAAILLTHRTLGRQGVWALVSRLTDWGRLYMKGWLVYLVLPLVFYLSVFALMRFLGFQLPSGWNIDLQLFLVFLVFLIGAIGEEIGYTAYAADPLLKKHPPVIVGLMLGIPWALWHLPSMIQIGQSVLLIVWGLMATIAFRIIYVHLYMRLGRSVFSIVLLHALFNTGRVAFPGGRDGFEQGDAAVGYSLVILVAILLSWLWRNRKSRDHIMSN
ncbi:MAG: CPBP family intramembrane metalloprotease [Pseudomonadales bacterium]|nr:CPBP family intramembrane metalloprotease [Pseudomonadales bacterium]